MNASYNLAVAILIIGGGVASARQQQYDSLGSPTPRPNQNASPNVAPNVSSPSTTGQSGSMERPSTPPKEAIPHPLRVNVLTSPQGMPGQKKPMV